MEIVGVYHDDALFSSGYIITLDDYTENAGNDLDYLVLAKRAQGVSDAAARAAVDPIIAGYPAVALQNQAEFKEQVAGQIDQLLGLVVVLLLLAVVIAVIGIINTLALSVFERTRELGLLRAVGMGRRQVKRMIRWESIIIAVLGAVLGLGVGRLLRLGGRVGHEGPRRRPARLPGRPAPVVRGLRHARRDAGGDLPGPAGLPPQRPRRDRPPVTVAGDTPGPRDL